MLTFRRIFLGSVLAAVMAFAAAAQEWVPSDPIRRLTGRTISLGAGHTNLGVGSYTQVSSSVGINYAVWDFGFESSGVRVCIRPDNQAFSTFPISPSPVVYIRFGTATTSDTAQLSNSATSNRMTVPASAFGAFMNGVSPYMSEGAIPMFVDVASGGSVSTTSVGIVRRSACYSGPWNTRGLVFGIASGQATIDAWAWSSERPR